MNETERILLVDDNEGHRMLMAEIIREKYPEVHIDESGDGLKAMEMIKSNVYDLIIIDYFLPTLSGLDFLRQTKPYRKDIPLVMVTGSGNEAVAAGAFKEGVTDYIIKGPDLSERLSETLDDVAGKGTPGSDGVPVKNVCTSTRAKDLIETIQKELRSKRSINVYDEKVVVEFDSASEFNNFSRWVAKKANVAMEKVEILENKFVILLSVSPNAIVRIS